MKTTSKNQKPKLFVEDVDTIPSAEPYETGYKKPPKHSQFKKGQSGNPKGKPKKKSIPLDPAEQILVDFMHTPIPVILDGKKTQQAPAELFPILFFKLAKSGNPKALETLYKLYVEALAKVTQKNGGKIKPFRWSDQSEKLTKFLERAVWSADKLDPDPNPTSSASESLDDEVDHPLPTKSNKIGKQ